MHHQNILFAVVGFLRTFNLSRLPEQILRVAGDFLKAEISFLRGFSRKTFSIFCISHVLCLAQCCGFVDISYGSGSVSAEP
jgi:hypothetical protein